ncbi:phage minor head protein [Paenibacillus sp. 2RAB27]|uniref:phage minor head protein n=1 Tax=Paenibacillus sp. 2RAB27 TaxID=3232991 RepID=UPI003F9BEA7F
MQDLEALLHGLSEPLEILKAIKDYTLTKGFDQYAEAIATKMVTHLFTDAGRTWRQAARKNSQGRVIYQALLKELNGPIGGAVRHQILRNAAIVKSLPLSIAQKVNEHVLTEAMKGTRAVNMAMQIKAFFPEATKAKAGLIARTETSKTSTALTRARSEFVGAGWYVWRSSRDSRVRDAHRLMDGVLIKWNSPPNPESLKGMRRSFGNYHAGDIFNCRCYPEPVIDLDWITWPAIVHYGGTLQRMNRKQFESIM